jgi:hypothetical protein
MTRGIIAAPGIISGYNNGFKMERGLSGEEIRYYLLYWDKIVIPDNNLVSIGLPEQELLLESGLVSRPLVGFSGRFDGEMIAQAIAEAQALTASRLFAAEPDTDWTVHQIGDVLSMPSRFLTKQPSVNVQLVNALPVPSENVPISEIIDFKDRRRAEFEALHQYIDEAYHAILVHSDPGIATREEMARIGRAVKNLDRVSTERWKTTKKYDLTAELSLDGNKMMTGAALASAFNFYAAGGVMVSLAGVAGALASMIKIGAKTTVSFEAAKGNLKLSYLSMGHHEGIFSRKNNSTSASPNRDDIAGARGGQTEQARVPGTDGDLFAVARRALAMLRKRDGTPY